MTNYKSYETERLTLRPTSTDDAQMLIDLFNAPKWIQFIGERNVKTIAEAKAYIEAKMLPQLERLGYANYTLIRKSDHTKLGSCGLYDREGLEGIDIGYALLPEFEKQGYAFEAASKMKDLAINEFGIAEINAITSKQNFASQKLLEKLDFKLMGTTILPNDTEELLLFSFRTLAPK